MIREFVGYSSPQPCVPYLAFIILKQSKIEYITNRTLCAVKYFLAEYHCKTFFFSIRVHFLSILSLNFMNSTLVQTVVSIRHIRHRILMHDGDRDLSKGTKTLCRICRIIGYTGAGYY